MIINNLNYLSIEIKIIIIVIIIIVIFNYSNMQSFIENFSNSFATSCKRKIGGVVSNVIKERGMNKKKLNQDWDFYLPCSYNKCEKMAKEIKVDNDEQKLFLIDGCDNFASKTMLWYYLVKEFGREDASKVMPETFLLNNENDMKLFENFYNEIKKINPKAKFILKNNTQRQQGIKLSDNLEDILKEKDKKSLLVQKYLENPFLISNRKINIRYYFLVVCTKDNISGYLHQNGFMYYTPKCYKENSLDFDENITSGYVPRKVYQENPLTIADFNKHIANEGHSPDKFFSYVKEIFKKVLQSLRKNICQAKNLKNNTIYQLFGADIAPDNQLYPYILEMNKGPDMKPKDKRDKVVKLKVNRDIMDIVDDLGNHKYTNPNQFHLVYRTSRHSKD